MRKNSVWIVLVLVLVLLSAAAAAQDDAMITVTDMAGRTVALKREPAAVAATGQPGAVLLYTLCPEKLVAWNAELTAESLPYIQKAYAALPVVGSLQGGKPAANPEEVVALAPDVIVYMTTLTKQTAAKADEIQAQTGVPILVASFDLISIGESYRFLGGALGCADKAGELARFCDDLTADIGEKASAIPQSERVTFYYTSGGAGLQTSPAGTNHTELIEFAGGMNVVDLPAESNGRLTVDMERILAWQPDVIIASTAEALKPVLQWEQVNAVSGGRVYTAPAVPFAWLDAPVSVNRIIGLAWAAETLYPEVYGYDIGAYAKEFYSLFYGIDLSDESLAALLPSNTILR